MKIVYKLFLIAVMAILASCEVDDYTDANPPGLLDGPEIYVYNPAAGVVTSTRSDNSFVTYVTKGQDASFSVEVVDAPGLIDSVSAYLSDTVGLVAVTGFDALKGDETGVFNVIYTPEPNDPASTFDDRIVNLSVSVSDAQIDYKGKKTPKTTQPRVRQVKALACVPTIDLSGFWQATASGNSSKAWTDASVGVAGAYTGLKSFVRLSIRTTGGAAAVGLNADVENGATLFINDASFGLFAKQGIALPTGRLSFCGSAITPMPAAPPLPVGYFGLNAAGTAFASQNAATYAGTINSDGSITITWSNSIGDSGTVTLVRPAPF